MPRRPRAIKVESTRLKLSREELVATLALSLSLLAVPAAFGRQNPSKHSQALSTTKQVQQVSADGRLAADANAASALLPTSTSPANQAANKASVSWDNSGLTIEAANSSLNQILRQVAFLTGAKLEAHTHDQRVFGSYGPGPASEVLVKLLDGCGYNVLIIGGKDGSPLLEIVLSARSAGTQVANHHVAQPPEEADDEQKTTDATEGPRPEEQNPFKNSNAELPKDPEKFMQAILDRQQKSDEQDQQKEQQKDSPQ